MLENLVRRSEIARKEDHPTERPLTSLLENPFCGALALVAHDQKLPTQLR
jgi:hypothetical protein